MTYLVRFRRLIILLLSVTLCTQAMAVASLGACHRMQALTAMTAMQMMAAPMAHDHADASIAHHAAAMHHADPDGTVPASDGDRVSCAACAACHLSSVILNNVNISTDIPVAAATVFADANLARVRNVASGLERPPRA